MASIAIEEATGWVAEGGMGRVLLLASLEAIAAALGAFLNLFMEEALPQVRTIVACLKDKKNKQSNNIYREKEEDEIITAKQCCFGICEQLGFLLI